MPLRIDVILRISLSVLPFVCCIVFSCSVASFNGMNYPEGGDYIASSNKKKRLM